MLDHADHTAPTPQHDLYHTDRSIFALKGPDHELGIGGLSIAWVFASPSGRLCVLRVRTYNAAHVRWRVVCCGAVVMHLNMKRLKMMMMTLKHPKTDLEKTRTLETR